MNIRFEYLYRDAGNFKNWGELVFKNKDNHNIHNLEKQARNVLIDNEYFVADKANIPNLQFQEHIEALDHNWHEFHSFQLSTSRADDSCGRDILEFIESLKSASKI